LPPFASQEEEALFTAATAAAWDEGKRVHPSFWALFDRFEIIFHIPIGHQGQEALSQSSQAANSTATRLAP